jgi:hypothetical protein
MRAGRPTVVCRTTPPPRPPQRRRRRRRRESVLFARPVSLDFYAVCGGGPQIAPYRFPPDRRADGSAAGLGARGWVKLSHTRARTTKPLHTCNELVTCIPTPSFVRRLSHLPPGCPPAKACSPTYHLALLLYFFHPHLSSAPRRQSPAFYFLLHLSYHHHPQSRCLAAPRLIAKFPLSFHNSQMRESSTVLCASCSKYNNGSQRRISRRKSARQRVAETKDPAIQDWIG